MRLPHQAPPVIRTVGRKMLFEQVLKQVVLLDGKTTYTFVRGFNINCNAPIYFKFPVSFFNTHFAGYFRRS
jgi:hypothetical protein